MKKCWKCAEEIQDAAVACRYCNANQNSLDQFEITRKGSAGRTIFKVALGLFGLVVVASFVAPDPAPTGNPDTLFEDAGMAADITAQATEATPVTAVALAKAFENNELQAMRKYGQSTLAVTGTLTGVDLDFGDNPIAKLESGKFLAVQAQFDKTRGADLASYNTGDEITVLCNRLGEIMGSPMLDDCWIG